MAPIVPFGTATAALLVLLHASHAFEQCSHSQGGGVCPDHNTCCPLSNNGGNGSGNGSGCIPSDMGARNATCCGDGETGCAVGYKCVSSNSTFLCSAVDGVAPMSDPLVQTLPRYHLCSVHPNMTELQGLPVKRDDDDDLENSCLMSYYSSHGSIENISEQVASSIGMVIIAIHGSNRNADDYFCSALKASQLQKYHRNVLVIAPWFRSESDSNLTDTYLTWADVEYGPWRFGADAISPRPVSSFTALDQLVQAISSILPGDTPIHIAGHSSGGQMVQRWALLTPIWSKKDSNIRVVVANPSSYAYLTPLRYRGHWKVPHNVSECPSYNRWEWGLHIGDGEMDVPYVVDAFRNGNKTQIIQQFLEFRHVHYLIGAQDRCNVSTSTPHAWCHSHGLETTCMDNWQGPNRHQRSVRYVASLKTIAGYRPKYHHLSEVYGVGHDHSLMFQSPEGIRAIFHPSHRAGCISSHNMVGFGLYDPDGSALGR